MRDATDDVPGPQPALASSVAAKPAGVSLPEASRAILARNGEAMATIHRPVEQSAAAKVPGSKLAEAGAGGPTRPVPPSPGGTPWEAGSEWGDPTMSDEAFLEKHLRTNTLMWADDLDRAGRPPELAQAVRDAVANGTVKVQKGSEVEGLNVVTRTIDTADGLSMHDEITRNPTGEVNAALEAGTAFWLWAEDSGAVSVTW